MKNLIEKYNELSRKGNGTIRNVIGVSAMFVVFYVCMFVACGIDSGMFK